MISLLTLGRKHHGNTSPALLTEEYLRRIQAYQPAERVLVADEAAFKKWKEAHLLRPAGWSVIFDSTGKSMSSEEFAAAVGRAQDAGQRRIAFSVGPADGWGRETLAQADLVLSLGRMTFAHELAALIVAEQVYRALTILAGHPYHLSHK